MNELCDAIQLVTNAKRKKISLRNYPFIITKKVWVNVSKMFNNPRKNFKNKAFPTSSLFAQRQN